MKKLISLFILLFLSSCDSASDLEELVDIALDPPERQEIDTARLGVNNFFVDSEFGTTPQQYSEIQNTLGLNFVRVLFAWSNEVQPTPESTPFYGFYDEIINNIPPGVDVLPVLVHAPDWMQNPANWTTEGNPRLTWVDRWLRPTVSRYAGNGRIIGWEVWNEPDLPVVPADPSFGLGSPENYFELLVAGSSAIRTLDPTALILNAATQSIAQNFPTNLNYNESLVALGATSLIDIYNVHYYSTNFENVVIGGGVSDFLNGLGMPVWITESGENGPNNQLAYAETTWPFLREQIPSIDRIYYFQFGETTPIDVNFGLRTTDPAAPVSDLYLFLQN